MTQGYQPLPPLFVQVNPPPRNPSQPTKAYMTIEEARKRKENLEREITRLVWVFQEQTGIGVKGFEQINTRQLCDPSSRIVQVSVITESI